MAHLSVKNGIAQKFANTEQKMELKTGKYSKCKSTTFGLSNVVIGAGSKDLWILFEWDLACVMLSKFYFWDRGEG